MKDLVRFSVSLEADLLEQFDRFCADGQFATRSEAIRQLLRERLAAAGWEAGAADVAASLVLVYDHHRPGLTERMTELQHRHGPRVVAAMHVHLSHDLCMETIALRGPAAELRELAGELGGQKGIHLARLVVAHADADGGGHAHPH